MSGLIGGLFKSIPASNGAIREVFRDAEVEVEQGQEMSMVSGNIEHGRYDEGHFLAEYGRRQDSYHSLSLLITGIREHCKYSQVIGPIWMHLEISLYYQGTLATTGRIQGQHHTHGHSTLSLSIQPDASSQ